MVSRIVVALGGNAILTKDPSAAAQKKALEVTAEQLMPLIKDNDRQMVVTHGNGPQVGMIQNAMTESALARNVGSASCFCCASSCARAAVTLSPSLNTVRYFCSALTLALLAG